MSVTTGNREQKAPEVTLECKDLVLHLNVSWKTVPQAWTGNRLRVKVSRVTVRVI